MGRKRKKLLTICLVVFAGVLLMEAVVIAGVNGWLPGSRQAKRKSEDRTEHVMEGSAENTDESKEISSEEASGTIEEDSKEALAGENVVKLKFRMGSLQEGDVPDEVFDQITRINSGETLTEVIPLEGLEGYFALTGTNTVIAEAQTKEEDEETGTHVVGQGNLTLHVPNLLAGLEEISVLFYENETGKWKLIPASKTDTEAKTVSVTLTGSGTLAVVYRRQTEKTD